MPTITIKGDYPDGADEAREDAVFAENAQRAAQALVDRGYKNVEVKAAGDELSLSREPEPGAKEDSATKK